MAKTEIVAKAVYFIDGDENAFEYQSMVISHEGSWWLVATWLLAHGSSERIPDRIVPLDSFTHVVEPSGLIRLGQLMPKQLLSVDCPHELILKFGAQLFPSLLHTQGPDSIQ